MSEQFQHLENIDSTVVFLYGIPGSGKTCFLASILRYFYDNDYDLTLNTTENPNGADYFMYLLQTIKAKKIPEITNLDENNEIDIRITLHKKHQYFTFVDVSGEHLIFKDDTDRRLNVRTKEKVDNYLKNPNISVILLSFFDPRNPKFSLQTQDMNHFVLWNYISEQQSDFYSIAGIITKLDMLEGEHPESTTYKEITRKLIEKDLPNAYNFIKKFDGVSCSIIPYSIGKVSDDNETLEYIDEKGAVKFIDWLKEIHAPPKRHGFKILVMFVIFIFILLQFLLNRFSFINTGASIAIGIATSFIYDWLKRKDL